MTQVDRREVEAAVLNAVASAEAELVSLCSRLVQVPAPMPPGDTSEIADVVSAFLRERGIDCVTYEPKPGKRSVVATIGPSDIPPALVVNGHLDTFEPAAGAWRHSSPYSGAVEDGRIYGAGASDMRAGVAAGLLLASALAPHASHLDRRIVFAFVGDEEAGGAWGTEWLLDNVDEIGAARAALIGDQCGTDVIGNAEKGVCFFSVHTPGTSSHAAYGSGDSAVHKLLEALRVIRGCENAEESGEDIADRVTANIGRITGGVARNLVAADARAEVSIRVPTTVSTADLMARLREQITDAVPDAWLEIDRQSEPSSTPADRGIVMSAIRATEAALGAPSSLITRVGASDARLFREHGIPTVVYGPAARNMGAIDEYVDIDQLHTVAQVHTRIALNFLLGESDD